MFEDPSFELQQHLGEGEVLLWSGKPKGGILFRSSDILPIVLGLVCLCSGIVFFKAVDIQELGQPASVEFAMKVFLILLLGIPVVLVGAYLIWGRFIINTKWRESSVYVVTNQRVISWRGIRNRIQYTWNIEDLADVSYSEKKDGSGSIYFNRKLLQPLTLLGLGVPVWEWGWIYNGIVFFDSIPNVKDVYGIIQKTREKMWSNNKHVSC